MERELCKDGNMSEVFSKWKLSEEIFLSSHCIPSFHPHLFFPHNYKGLVFLPCYITCLCQNDLKVWFGSFALKNVLHYRRKEKDRNLVEIKLANIYNFKIHINQWDRSLQPLRSTSHRQKGWEKKKGRCLEIGEEGGF